jgi:proteasome accessory factor B
MSCNADVALQKEVTMSSRKTERLINLTMALLATKRYLTKSEIFRSIEGYEGNQQSQERMFERDKDDLRKLGITIEVGGIDPTFEDEPGYRIRPESYALNLGTLSGLEVALLSLAAEAWHGAALSEPAQSVLLKLRSLGIASDFDSLPTFAPKLTGNSSNFVPLAHAISDRIPVSFHYRSIDLQSEERFINPYGMGNRGGNWYLVGFDRDRAALRTFRLDRISDQVVNLTQSENFEAPRDFDVLGFLDTELFEAKEQATVKIRNGKGYALRQNCIITSSDDEFDYCEVPYNNHERFLDLVLWHGDDVVVVSPTILREAVIEKLQKLVTSHG